MLRNLTIFFLSKSVYLVQTPILLMIDAKMFSLPWKRLFKKFATISLQVVIIFLTNSVIIATTKTLEFSLIYMYLKDKRDDHHTLTPVCIVQRFRFFVRFFFFVSEPQSPSYLNLVTFYKLACGAGVLLGRVNVKKFAIIYSAHHVWFGDWGSGMIITGWSSKTDSSVRYQRFPSSGPLTMYRFLTFHWALRSACTLLFRNYIMSWIIPAF